MHAIEDIIQDTIEDARSDGTVVIIGVRLLEHAADPMLAARSLRQARAAVRRRIR